MTDQFDPAAATIDTASDQPRRRLHPLTPILRGAKFVALVIAAVSWQGYRTVGNTGWGSGVAALIVVVLAASVVSWFVTGYHVVGRELRVYEGLLWRRTRAIPLERLQSVEIVRPLLARLLGLAELRLEVIGAAKTEAPLAFVTMAEATRLRAVLLAVANGPAGAVLPPAPVAIEPFLPAQTRPADAWPTGAGLTGAGLTGAGPIGHVASTVLRVSNRMLLQSQLLRPQWWALPLAIAAPIYFFVYQEDLSFVGVASTITAVAGAIQAPVRVLLADWGFTLSRTPDALVLRRGLTETRNQTVPYRRVQAISVQWPLLWRPLGWVRAHMEVAGVTAARPDDLQGGSLVPVADVPSAERVIATALPGFVLRSVVVAPVPARARWLAPLAASVYGYQLGSAAFVTRDGVLTRRLVIVGYERIQSVRVRQSALQRLFRLASVWVDTAGGGLPAVAAHRDVREARDLAERLMLAHRAAVHHLGDGGPGWPDMPSGPDGVESAVDVNDLAGGGREPV